MNEGTDIRYVLFVVYKYGVPTQQVEVDVNNEQNCTAHVHLESDVNNLGERQQVQIYILVSNTCLCQRFSYCTMNCWLNEW